MEREKNLFLVLKKFNYNEGYRFYKIGDNEDEETDIKRLKIDGYTFPEDMNFAKIGSRIYMVGGSDHKKCDRIFNKVFIYDTKTSKIVPGPPMNSPKLFPYLITLGSKLFALSIFLNFRSDEMKDRPRFEMLDTKHLDRGWLALPFDDVPFDITHTDEFTFAAVFIGGGGVIFASLGPCYGTWAFDVDKLVWNCVSAVALPFKGQAVTIPYATNLCCGRSLKSNKLCVYRFCYESDKSNHGFQVSEFEMDVSYLRHGLSWPSLIHCDCQMVVGRDGQIYCIDSGVDEDEFYDRRAGRKHYVKIIALEFSNLKASLNEKQLLKSSKPHLNMTKNKKRRRERDENQDKIKTRGIWKKCFFIGHLYKPYSITAVALA